MESPTDIRGGRPGNVMQKAATSSSIPAPEKPMTTPRSKQPLMKRFMRWLVPDQRVANRHPVPPLIAYLGMVRSTKQYQISDVSVAGFYMITEERWVLGTGFPVTMERTDAAGSGNKVTIHATVVRTGADGVGFTFLQPADQDAKADANARIDLTALAQFLKGLPLSDTGSDGFERAS